MLKCNINRERKHVQVKANGEPTTITSEVLVLIKTINQGIEQQNPEAARAFRNTVTAAMLDPTSPLWEEN